VGFNYRLTNVQAAMGVAQLGRLDEFLSRKKAIRHSYAEGVAELENCAMVGEASWAQSAFWLNTMRLTDPNTDRKVLHKLLKDVSIETRPLWQPLHMSPAHEGSWFKDCKVSEVLYKQCLNLPSSTSLTDSDLNRVVSAVKGIFS
jgi:perosamine synthetase